MSPALIKTLSRVFFQLALFAMCNAEFFHIVAHFLVLTRLHLFDKLDEKAWYFLFDGISSLICYLVVLYLYGKSICWIEHITILFQIINHLCFYVPNWNTDHYYANRILQWSSIGYKGDYVTADWFLTVSDIMAHCILFYHLAKYILSLKVN